MDAGITGHSLWFTGPRLVEIREASVPTPGPRQVVVQTTISAISAGTEMLVYRGQAPADLSADSNLPSLAGTLGFPLRYGYATVGRVIAAGSGVSDRRIGEAVFAFQSHATHFLAAAHDVLPIPPTISAERAAFLPNVETAVNLLLDGVPRVGEQVAVLGQGVVGLLVTALLARIPLASLVTVDRYPTRRQASLALGARACLDASQADLAAELVRHLQADRSYSGADLTFELSGDPSTLDLAIAATGQAGRVVLGSWYGTKRAAPDLGGRFHRSRIRLISSQVSTLPSELGAAWTTTRRLQFALSLLPTLPLETLVSHRIDFHRAHDAYRMLDERPAEALQVLLTYGSNG
jgi:2-desacetyl-2-hydroxyethyl bacteriochlorophyllide A dehydrogenase